MTSCRGRDGCTTSKYNHKRFYNDLCAPTITLAVGLNSCVVVQPETADRANVANNKVALMAAVFLLCFLQRVDNDVIGNSYKLSIK